MMFNGENKKSLSEWFEIDAQYARFAELVQAAAAESPDEDTDHMMSILNQYIVGRRQILTNTINYAETQESEWKKRRVALGLPAEPEYEDEYPVYAVQ